MNLSFGKRRKRSNIRRKNTKRSSASKRRSGRKSASKRASKRRSGRKSIKIIRSKRHGPYFIKSNKIHLLKGSKKSKKSYKLIKNKNGIYFNRNKKKNYIVKTKGHGFGSMPGLNQIMGNYAPAEMSLYEQNNGMPAAQFIKHMSGVDPSLLQNFNTNIV